MGLWDSIKKKLNFSIFGVSNPKLAEEIKELNLGKVEKVGKKISIVINSPTINIYEGMGEAIDKAEHLLFIDEIGWINEEIAVGHSIIAENYNNPGEVIKDLRPILEGEDYAALSLIIRIIKLEDKGMNTKKLYWDLFKAYGPRGIRLYSLCRSGILNEFAGDIRNNPDKFNKDYLEKLITSPEPIFVGSIMEEKDLLNTIEGRLKRLKNFQIFARSGRVQLAVESIEKICKKYPDILFKIDPYKIGDEQSVVIYVQKIKKKKKKTK